MPAVPTTAAPTVPAAVPRTITPGLYRLTRDVPNPDPERVQSFALLRSRVFEAGLVFLVRHGVDMAGGRSFASLNLVIHRGAGELQVQDSTLYLTAHWPAALAIFEAAERIPDEELSPVEVLAVANVGLRDLLAYITRERAADLLPQLRAAAEACAREPRRGVDKLAPFVCDPDV